MKKKVSIEILISLIILTVIVVTVSTRSSLFSHLEQGNKEFFVRMEGYFKDLYTTESIRNLHHETDIHILNYLLLGEKESRVKYEDDVAKFDQQLLELYQRQDNLQVEQKAVLDRIGRLQKQKTSYIQAFLESAPKVRPVRTLFSAEFNSINSELKDQILKLVDLETKLYTNARADVLKKNEEVVDKLISTSTVVLVINITMLMLVIYLILQARQDRLGTLRALKSRDDILAVVSHDLKNPLTSINLNVQLIEREANERTIKCVKGIKRSVNVMLGLIQGLLDQVKLEAGGLEMVIEDEIFNEILMEAEEVLTPLAKNKSIEIVNSSPEASSIIKCDRKRLMQVLLNIIGNAIKFSSRGDKIIVATQEEGKNLIVSISDTGPGIPERDIPHLFDRYWQAQKTAKQGTGLGLSIVKGIVEAHGGKVWVNSKLNEGTTFWFSVPLAFQAV